VPRALQYYTGYVGYHHVRNLAPKIANYHLRASHESHTRFQKASVVELLTIWQVLCLFVFDEHEQRLRSFRDVRTAST
jgi:acyl-lipid omega-6 desaturase (Delta-12 desaturase)